MKTQAQFTNRDGRDEGVRVVRIHLSRNGKPFALVFGGTSWRTTGKTAVWFGDRPKEAPAGTRMYEMRHVTDPTRTLWVDQAGAFVHLE
jgi:hypothetical protein